MKLYSATTRGFYDESIHGSIKIKIVEPGWERPLIDVPDPDWVRPTVEGPDPDWEPVEGEEPPIISIPDDSAIAPMIAVPDMTIEAPLVEIDNPDCKIPPDAVEVSTQEHEALMLAQASGKRIIFDVELGKPVAAEQPLPSAAEVIAAKLAAINTACEAEIAAISAGYPASEVLSWTKQEAEARAFTADAEAVTPLLDSLAAARGITKTELASRVIAKADLFAQISGAIIGKRQALEDQIDVISAGLWGEELAAPITPELQTQLDTVQWNAEGEQP